MALPTLTRDPIIRLNEAPDQATRGIRRLFVVFWIPVDSVDAAPNPRARSVLEGYSDSRLPALTQTEKDLITAGQIVERVLDFPVPWTWDETTKTAFLKSAYNNVKGGYLPEGTNFGKTIDPSAP